MFAFNLEVSDDMYSHTHKRTHVPPPHTHTRMRARTHSRTQVSLLVLFTVSCVFSSPCVAQNRLQKFSTVRNGIGGSDSMERSALVYARGEAGDSQELSCSRTKAPCSLPLKGLCLCPTHTRFKSNRPL